jgi:hypothetical protein
MAFCAKATAGVYAEVIQQIYDSLDKRFREAVSNAYDAKATKIEISVYTKGDIPERIDLYDDGQGMDKEDISSKYICLGGGDNYGNHDTIGRIGIGALSVFALGDHVTVTTRKKGTDKVITAVLQLGRIKAPERHATPLDQVEIGEIAGERTATDQDPEHFTHISIQDLSKSARRLFQEPDETSQLVTKLERILPIKYRDDEPLFNQITDELRKEITGSNYLIDVVMHIPHLDINHQSLRRRAIYSIPEAKIECLIPLFPFQGLDGSDSGLRIFGYLYTNRGKQLPKPWQGINARVKNVTIERNTFFDYEDDPTARVRIGGELFIEHIAENDAIQSNRSGFAKENSDYRAIADYMSDYIAKAIANVRKSDRISSIVKKIINKMSGYYEKCKAVSEVQDAKESSAAFYALSDPDVILEEVVPFSLEDAIVGALAEIDVNSEVVWAGTLKDTYYVEREDDDFYTILVHERLKDICFDVAGNTLVYILGDCGEGVPPVVKTEGSIYINLGNPLLGAKNVQDLDLGAMWVEILLYLNYLRCRGNAHELFTECQKDLLGRV